MNIEKWIVGALVAAVGCSPTGRLQPPPGETFDLATGAPPDLAPPPPDLTPHTPGAVGAPCGVAADCSGPKPQCRTMIGAHPAPSGYCSSTPCRSDFDCGLGGFCDTPSRACLGSCDGPNQCQRINPDNRCFTIDAQHAGCLPGGFGTCMPTVAGSCPNGGGCHRDGYDDVGFCMVPCTLDVPCPAPTGGGTQKCLFFNDTVDFNGQPTNDKFIGLGCYPDFTDNAPGTACVFRVDCTPGYECDEWQVGGSSVCRKLCQLNHPGDCRPGTSCQNAFRLATFSAGDYGLCL